MPIKIPKSFARRKSSANALEEVQNAPATTPSFRVFERTPAGNRSWDGTNALKQPSQVRTFEATENVYDKEIFPVNKDDFRNRGSGGTNNSASTAPYGSGASSASSSTIPSSTDISNDSHTNSMVSGQRPFQDKPAPPVHQARGWSIKNAGRTFSFASKQKNEMANEPLPPRRPSPISTPSATFTPGRRERAMTASTASTATPPKLLDSELSLVDSELDGFGNMFDGFGNRSNRNSATRYDSNKTDLPLLQYRLADPHDPQQPSPLPPSLDIDRAHVEASSPYSLASHGSRDRLMNSPSPTQLQSNTAPTSPLRRKALPSSPCVPNSQAFSNPLRQADVDSHDDNTIPYAKSPSPVEDEGMRLLAGSVARRDNQPPSTNRGAMRKVGANGVKGDNSDNEELLFSTPSPNRPNISRTAPKRAPPLSSIRQLNDGAVDSSLGNSVRLAAQDETNAPGSETPAKEVMKPAQSEEYRRQRELSSKRSDGPLKGDPNGESANDEEKEEAEQDREAAKQRSKQEAHLAIYRQTMMKVTGESSGDPGSNAGPSGRLTSMSTPELSRMSHLTVGTGVSSHSGKSSGTDDEDDDIPLGILAAHGFPNRNRPPSRLYTSSLNPTLRISNPLSAPPASVSGDSRAGSRGGNLPVFARNLPQDPYFGTGLVNPPIREHFPTGGAQSSFGGVSQGQVHPSGLVGVIAGEERARAMRRGSPNHVNQDQILPGPHPGMMGRSQTMGAAPNMNMYPGPGMPAMMPLQALSPGDQAQIQMAQQMNQMNQMMQMQMQWMQQMTLMQQNGQMGQMPPPPQPGMMPMTNFMGSPGEMGNLNPRPFSVPLPDSSRQNGRAMSLSPGMASQWNRNSSYSPSMVGGQNGYAASIAPSERNTVGMASRYRPVSIVAESIKAPEQRASTFTSGTSQAWAQNSEQGRLSPSNTNTTIRPSPTSALGQEAHTPDDEDDDQGWAEMKKKRDKKKGMWRMKKSEKSGG